MINKLIISSAFYKRGAVPPEFWKIFEHPSFGQMPEKLKQAFLKVNNDEKALLNMFNKDSNRMKNFKGWTDEQMKSISSPALILNGDHDIGSVEHSVEMFRIMPNARLAILPGTHGSYLGTIETIEDEWTGTYVVDLVEEFLQC
jgi:pimeloyl-ACP methyl ester carboxylesterase